MSRQSEENVIILGEVPSTWVDPPPPRSWSLIRSLLKSWSCFFWLQGDQWSLCPMFPYMPPVFPLTVSILSGAICLLWFNIPCLFCQGDHCRGAICLLPLANLLLLLPSWLHWTVPRQLPLHKWLMMITCPFWYIYLFIWLIKLVFIKYNFLTSFNSSLTIILICNAMDNDDTLSILISKITYICLIKVVFITSHFLTDNWGMLWWKW